MTSPSNRPIQIVLNIQSDQTALLEGLDVWLRLGLISDEQVKRLCQQFLVCQLPQEITTTPVVTTSPSPQTTDFVVEAPRREKATTRRTGVLQSFMAEVSILWLLFLGVFLVVVSSAVLAASQWRNFSPVGQYGILFAYTLIFWGISAWAGKQPNLHLTARMLGVTTLLIIPVNFWMMDGFKLWGYSLGWVAAGVAALTLTGILINVLQSSLANSRNSGLTIINSIGLSWLHWGWAIPGVPLIATYIGTIGTAFVLFYQSRRGGVSVVAPPNNQSLTSQLSLGTIAIAFATLLLVGRAVLVAHIPLSQLGLALGTCGWLLCWLSRRDAAAEVWAKAGLGLLIAGWLVSVEEMPEQALAVSGLGLWLLADRLQRLNRSLDLTTLFLVGLQSFWLLWRLIPSPRQQEVIAFGIRLAGNEFMPWGLIGLGVFPYVVITLLLASGLRGRQQQALAIHAEAMALILGCLLTLISAFNPLVRSLNLSLSFITLAVVVYRRTEAEIELIYLTHAVGLGTITAGIYVAQPNLSINNWIGILLVGMLAEWIFSIGIRWTQWRRSAWHLGIGLAAISYFLLTDANLTNATAWRLGWLITPVALSLLAYVPHFPQPRLAAWLSIVAAVVLQPWTIDTATPRLISLGVGTAVILLSTQKLQELVAAFLTVGFALSFSFAGVWQIFYDRMTFGGWVTVLAIDPLVLWLVYSWLKVGSTRLHQVYRQATNGWAIALTIPTLTLLTGYNLIAYIYPTVIAWEFILAAAILTLALSYRNWQEPSNWGFYGLGLAVELLVASIVVSSHLSLDWLAVATLALGLITQLAGDWRIGISATPYLSSLHVIPILYAILGLLLSHHNFEAFTGLYTLAAALIGIGVGRRTVKLKPITYISILAVSAAVYELLVYQLMQVKGGSAGDAIALLAILAGAIAICQRLLERWLLPYLRLNARELRLIAHFHWGIGSGLILLALASSLSVSGERIWLGVTTILASYALIQGRAKEEWTYAGIVEFGLAVGYGLHLILPDTVLQHWSAAIACLFASAMYFLPWNNWGWSITPWRNSALLLPGIIIALTVSEVTIQSLLIVAAFYAWLAKAESKIRLSYFSIILANWAIIRILFERSITDPLWYAILGGGSLLYVAQVDPGLQAQSERYKRHLLRSLATGLICLTALYQAEMGIQGFSPFGLGLLTIGLGLVFSFVGIALRVRAFLYLGTITFIVGVLRQIWLFINDYSLFLWAIGIVFGSALIWIALTFEARRSQVLAFVQYWLTELENWE